MTTRLLAGLTVGLALCTAAPVEAAPPQRVSTCVKAPGKRQGVATATGGVCAPGYVLQTGKRPAR